MPENTERLEAIKELYRKLLLREADIPGLNHYYTCNLSLEQISNTIENSPERAHVVRTKINKEFVVEFIEPSVAVTPPLGQADIRLILKELKDEKIQRVIVLPVVDGAIKEAIVTAGFEVIELNIPNDAMLSISDTKRLLSYIDEAFAGTKTLISGFEGKSVAAGLMYLWYMGHGMDEAEARLLIFSRVNNVVLDDVLFGPWHINTAKAMYKGK
jgi:hypothetical protein